MKLEVTLASGTRLLFEGERDDFDHMAELLNLPEVIGGGLKPAVPPPPPPPPSSEGTGASSAQNGEIDARALSERLKRLGVSKHTERLAVMAQVAVEAGKEGLDFDTAERLYRAIGEPKPGNWKSAFSNARTAGLVLSVARGLYKPTTKGENFALYGPEALGSMGRRQPQTRSHDDESQEGGEDD